MKDVKQKHQQKLIENEIKKEQEKKYLEELTFKNSPEYSNWRSEISEQMTTTDVFYSTLPATGDVDLLNPELVSTGNNNGSIANNIITIGGDPAPYLTNGIILKFDSSLYDTLKFNVNIPSGNILGFLIGNSPSASLIVTSSGTYTLKVPQSKNLSIVLDVIESSTVTISNFSFQRRTPLNVFVSLDSPEAASFIRTGSGDLSPEEKQKKLKEMLEASDEYVQQMYGDEFPGTGAVPPGEAGDTPGVDIQDFQIASEPLRGQKTDIRYDPNMKMFVPRPSEKDAGELIQTLVKTA